MTTGIPYEPALIICRPCFDTVLGIQHSCYDCRKRGHKGKSPGVVRHQEWYGWHGACMRCGREWEDGEGLPAPFARGWREKNIKSARRLLEDFWHDYRQHYEMEANHS